MMLKTSSRKINPFWNMTGFTTRKNLGIIVVLCIASLIYYPGTFIVDYENLIVRAENSVNNYLLESFASAIAVLAAIVAVLFNTINFSFLYKKNSSDVFHAFPLTRSELLLSRLLSGLISTFIPTLLSYISFGILMAFNSWMGSFPSLLCYLLYTVIIILVCSSFSMIFVVCAGSSFDLGVSLIGGNLALLAVGWIFESILDETLVGYNGYRTSDIMYNLSPPYFCGVALSGVDRVVELGFIKSTFFEFLIRSIVYIIAFSGASLLLYNRRKAEKGGTAYAYKFMYLGCSLLAGICGGFLLGMMLDGNVTSLPFWFFTVIGCLLTAVIYGTVTNRGFKGVGRSILMGILSAIVIISVAVIGVTGGLGYTNRIPRADKIKSVSITAFDENIPFEDPQQILDLHQAILDTKATDYEYDYSKLGNVKLYYELENGTTISRDFTVYAPLVSDELLSIFKSEERLQMIKQQLNILNAEKINLYFYYNGAYHSADITEQEAEEFIRCYWQDVQSSDKRLFDNGRSYEFTELSGEKPLDNNRTEYFSFRFEWHDSFTNTKQFIENESLVERSKQQQTETYEKY